jgi:GNAT superfamily N-acetyltransferase
LSEDFGRCQLKTANMRRCSLVTPKDVADAGELLGRAFRDDPLMRYYFEGDRDRTTPVRKTMTLAAELTLHYGRTLRLDCDGTLTGAALLLPESIPDFPLVGVIAAVARTPALWRPRALKRHFGVSASIEAHRPTFPCAVLLSLGVEPERQHRGHGAWLLDWILASLPASSAVCLETDNERNVPLYLRHGFAVTSEYLTHDGRGPRTWSMLRRGNDGSGRGSPAAPVTAP